MAANIGRIAFFASWLTLATICVAAGFACDDDDDDACAPDAPVPVGVAGDDDNDDDDDQPAPPDTVADLDFCRPSTGLVDPALAYLGNGRVEIAFSRATGAVRQVRDRARGLSLLAAPDPQTPAYEIFEIVPTVGGHRYKVERVRHPVLGPAIECAGNTLTMTWEYPPRWPTVTATWTVDPQLPELRATIAVHRLRGRTIQRVRYPILAPLAPLVGDGTEDAYLTPVEGGLLAQEPLARVAEESAGVGEILSFLRYPVGHEAMAQMVAYLHPGAGGALLYTADPGFHAKVFGLADRAATDERETGVGWQVDHMNPDAADEAGADAFTVAYETVLRWLDGGSWEEAASVYREWSDRQPWAADPIAARPPGEREFFERIGASIFGLTARADQRPWIAGWREALLPADSDARLLFVPAWDFRPMGEPPPDDYLAMAQGGAEERFWLPFADATYQNVAQIQDQGDWALLFLYDVTVGANIPGWDFATPEGQSYFDFILIGATGGPTGFVTWDVVNNGMLYTLDPADPFVADFWRWRSPLLVNETDPPLDGLYFDLGFSAAVWDCYDHLAGVEHGHPSGAGPWMIEAVRANLDQPLGTPNPRGFRYGSENAGEPYVDLVDFYHLGSSGVGPIRDKIKYSDPPEFYPFYQWVLEGAAREVPLFAFLNHHNGDLRTGGKIVASADIGDVFYWIAAAEYAWGGVVELIYFNTPADWLPTLDAAAVCPEPAERCGYRTGWVQKDDPAVLRGWHYDDEVRPVDPDKIAFLRDAIALRVDSPAAPYLTRGRMEPSPPARFDPAVYAFDYSYFLSIGGPDYYHSGTWSAPPGHVTAWRHPDDDRVAVVVANAAGQSIELTVTLDPATFGLPGGSVAAVDWRTGSRTPQPSGESTLTLAPRSFTLFEITP